MAKSKDLLFRVLGKDVSASKTLKGVGATAGRVGKGLGGIGTAFAGIGTAAAVAGAVIAVDFGKQSVDAFMDAQESQAKFEGSLAKNGLGKYTQQIDELSAALALKTKFDDDATKSGAAVLANFGLTGNELLRIIPLVQDYAAFTGKDMTTASETLGKAFLGNTRALKALGIEYKPTGDRAKDMAAIMELLNEKVGGFAEKQGKTAAGTAQILANQFGELQEKIGAALLPILMKLAPIGLKLVEWLSSAADALTIFIDAFTGKSEINEFDGALRVVNNTGIALGEAFQTVAKWFTTTVLPAIRSLAASFMKDVWPAIQQVAGTVAKNLQPAIEALAVYWRTQLVPGFKAALPWIKELLRYLGFMWGTIATVVSWIIGRLVPAILKVSSVMVGFSLKVRDVVVSIRDRFTALVDFVRSLPNRIAWASIGMWNGIRDSFRAAVNWIIARWNNLSFSLPGVNVPGIGQIGGFTLNTPNIPMLANGGIVTQPTLAMIGEAGPEAVVPLDRYKGNDRPTVIQLVMPNGKVLAETLVDYRNSIRRPLGLA